MSSSSSSHRHTTHPTPTTKMIICINLWRHKFVIIIAECETNKKTYVKTNCSFFCCLAQFGRSFHNCGGHQKFINLILHFSVNNWIVLFTEKQIMNTKQSNWTTFQWWENLSLKVNNIEAKANIKYLNC